MHNRFPLIFAAATGGRLQQARKGALELLSLCLKGGIGRSVPSLNRNELESGFVRHGTVWIYGRQKTWRKSVSTKKRKQKVLGASSKRKRLISRRIASFSTCLMVPQRHGQSVVKGGFSFEGQSEALICATAQEALRLSKKKSISGRTVHTKKKWKRNFTAWYNIQRYDSQHTHLAFPFRAAFFFGFGSPKTTTSHSQPHCWRLPSFAAPPCTPCSDPARSRYSWGSCT